MKLQPQLCVMDDPLDPARFNPPTNRIFVKPDGGLWTSTFDPIQGSDWIRWCIGNDFCVPDDGLWNCWLITPQPEARVLVIDSLNDLISALDGYAAPDPIYVPETSKYGMLSFLDFEHLAQDYDAVHLTDDGQTRTRFSIPSLYGWDCESTLFLTWKFDYSYLGKLHFPKRG